MDPLDGTINYANGIPYFCVSVGLVVDGRPAVGAVCDPMRGETYWATADGPAMLGERVVHASAKDKLTDCVISLSLGGRAVATRARAVRRAVRASRNTGSAALALAYVANGRFDAFLQSGGMSAWDVAAAGLIAERGGAVVTDTAGGPWFDVDKATRAFGIVAAPPAHHAELLRLSREGSGPSPAPLAGSSPAPAVRAVRAAAQPPRVAERGPALPVGTVPAELVHVGLGDRHAVGGRAQAGQVAEQQRLVHALAQRRGEGGRAAEARHVPVAGAARGSPRGVP